MIFLLPVMLLLPIALLAQGIQISFQGLPAGDHKNDIYTRVISMKDGAILFGSKNNVGTEVNFEPSEKHLLLSASYLNSMGSVDYIGWAGVTSQQSIVLPMQQANMSTDATQKYKTYPPAKGRAIGYNNKDFKITGSESSALSPRTVSAMLTVDLGMNRCQQVDNSYVVVAAADPEMMALIDAELELQNSPHFDAEYKVNPHLIGPTHLAEADLIMNPGDYTVSLRIRDLNGNVTASVSMQGSDFFETFQSASTELINQLCHPTIEYLDGYINVNIETSKYSPDKKEQTQSEITSTSISGKITLRIVRDRILNYIEKPVSRNECDPSQHCPVVAGGSDFQARDPYNYLKILFENRYPLTVSKKKDDMGYRGVDGKEKYVNTYHLEAADTNNVEGLHLEIKSYVAGQGQVAPLLPYYVIWLTGGKYPEKMLAHAFGKGTVMQWDLNMEKLVTVDDPVSVGIPFVIAEPEANMDIYKTYDPLLIKNAPEFEKYLLNPVGAFNIVATGERSQGNENYASEEKVSVTISLSPHKIQIIRK